MNAFSSLHPAAAAFYFLSVLTVTVFTANPFLLGAALLGGVLFFWKIRKNARFWQEAGWYLLFFALITLTNPLFSHRGVTPLFFLNRNPVTLEALLYGANLAVMLIAAVFWFRCFQQILTEDKLLFLLGGLSPKISLLICSALRFIPLFREQAVKIRRAQTAMGLYASDAWTDRLKGTVRAYSALITWALENAVDTGSSMKARGWGLKGRSRYFLYSFGKSDALFCCVTAALDAAVLAAVAAGQLSFSFYPAVCAPPAGVWNISAVIAFAVLSLLPFLLEIKEELLWNYYRSKI